MTMFGLELLIIGKIAAALKGAVIVSMHHGLGLAVVKGFVVTAHSAGLVTALQWLITMLAGVAGTAAVITAIEKLIEAVEEGEPRGFLMAAADAVTSAIKMI
jgi:hypothetical protein